MSLSTPDNVQLFGTAEQPPGSGGFKLTGRSREGAGFCRVWLRPIEAWDRYNNPRMESEAWDVRAYRKLDSAYEFVPEFTLEDLKTMAENFEFPDAESVFNAIELNGDPVHDRVVTWARQVTGSESENDVPAYQVRQPKTRYADGGEALDYHAELVRAPSTPAPLGGVKQKGPVAVPESAKKIAPPDAVKKPAAKAAELPSSPSLSKPPADQPENDAGSAKEEQFESEPTPVVPETSGGTQRLVSPAPSDEALEAPESAGAEESSGSDESASKPPAPPTEPPSVSKSAPPALSAAKRTQVLSRISDDDIEEDKLNALRERLAKARKARDNDSE